MKLDFDQVEAVMSACALRFDAYTYLRDAWLGPQTDRNEMLVQFRERFVEGYQAFPAPEENFAAFFALERLLVVANGGFFCRRTRDEIAAVHLYLQLYRLPTPAAYVNNDAQRQWEFWSDRPAEFVAAFLREWLVSGSARPGTKPRRKKSSRKAK
jgi:hypothetical protein